MSKVNPQHVSDLPVGNPDNCCQHGITDGKTVMQHEQSCVICYDPSGKVNKPVTFKAGHVYKKCSPVVADPDGGVCVVVPMTDKNQEVIGVVMCDCIDLSAEGAENCDGKVLRCATFDMNRMCWDSLFPEPDSFDAECLKLIAFNHDKPCFTTRMGCAIMPDYYQTTPKKAG